MASHYELLHKRAISGQMEDSDLLRLIQWEHAEIHGKPKDRIDLAVSGQLNVTVQIA